VRGFSLHLSTRIAADHEAGKRRLFRYVLRPAITRDRLSFDGETVRYEMKRAWSDGRRVLELTPETFIKQTDNTSMRCSWPWHVLPHPSLNSSRVGRHI
jgi:hypothetical protein